MKNESLIVKILKIIGIIFLIEIVVVVLCALFITDKEKWFSPGFLIAVFIIILTVGLPFRILRWLRRK